MNLRETYNRIAKDWHRDHQQDDWWIEGTDTFISFLQKDNLVLDIGCGAGTKSKYLIERGLRVVGIDFAEKMIEIAKTEVPSGTFLTLNLSEVDKLEYLFDGIFMQAVLLHIPRKEAVGNLKKIAEKLKKSGSLYIAVKEKKSQEAEEEVMAKNDYGYPYEVFFSYFTVSEIESHLRNVGFEIVFSEVNPSGNTNWIQVIGKK